LLPLLFLVDLPKIMKNKSDQQLLVSRRSSPLIIQETGILTTVFASGFAKRLVVPATTHDSGYDTVSCRKYSTNYDVRRQTHTGDTGDPDLDSCAGDPADICCDTSVGDICLDISLILLASTRGLVPLCRKVAALITICL